MTNFKYFLKYTTIMSENNFPDYITFPRTFEKYRWYKPILVLIIGTIVFLALQALLLVIFSAAYGSDSINALLLQGYESLNSEVGSYIGYLSVAIFLPSLYIATKIVRDRPFSSYSSSRGGWNWKLFFKSLTIPLAVYLIFEIMNTLIHGQKGSNTLTITFFIICLIIVPLQCIGEEYIMRGLVMQTFGSWFKIPVLAIVLQSIVFTSLHPYSILGVIGVFIQGICLGFLAWRSNGLEASSAIHSVNNLISAYFVALGFEVSSSVITPYDFASTIIVSVISTLALYYVGTKKGWFEEKTEKLW